MVEYNIELDNKELAQNMRRWEREMPDFIRGLLNTFSSKLEALASERAGNVLNVITGDLRGSIFSNMRGRDVLEIGAGSNIVYAKIHEFGGTIKAKHGNYLRFSVPGGGFVSKKQVHIQARPYVKPTIETFFRDGGAENIARGYFNRKKREYGFS